MYISFVKINLKRKPKLVQFVYVKKASSPIIHLYNFSIVFFFFLYTKRFFPDSGFAFRVLYENYTFFFFFYELH